MGVKGKKKGLPVARPSAGSEREPGEREADLSSRGEGPTRLLFHALRLSRAGARKAQGPAAAGEREATCALRSTCS
jgi:hypothetical protein